MALENMAEAYFSSLNSIASRINADLKETKGAYDDLWRQLSQEEKDQILNESIIKPEVSMKYCSTKTKSDEEFAVKIVVEDHCTYRDEHSGPFSFRTKSQRNLTLFSADNSKTQTGIKSIEPISTAKTKIITKVKSDVICPQSDVVTNTTPLRDEISNTNTLPKTGLDFLDNW